LQVTSPIGCKNLSAPVTVTIHPLPVVNLGNDTVLLPTQVVQLNAGAGFSSYIWSTGATTQQATIDNSGTGIGVKTVWVVVTDINGCKGSDTLKINFTNNPGMEDPEMDNVLKVFPNPTKGMVEIALPGIQNQPCTIGIFSIDGRLVFENLSESNEGVIRLNLNNLPAGHYLIKATSASGSFLNKLIISK
jgi:hypothetical protein